MSAKSNVKKNRFRLISILLPVLNTVIMGLGVYFSKDTRLINLTGILAYILCFDFLYLFYIEVSERISTDSIISAVLMIIIPIICFYSANFRQPLFIIIICLVFTVLLAGLVSISLGSLMLLGVTGFIALFASDIFKELVPLFIFTFAVCIMTEYIRDIRSLLPALIIEILFFVILMTVSFGFVLKNAVTPENILVCVIALMISTAEFFIRHYSGIDNKEDIEPNYHAETENQSETEDQAETKGQAETKDQQQIKELEQKLSDFEARYSTLEDSFKMLAANTDCRISTLISPDYTYSAKLKTRSPKLFDHCSAIAKMSAEASDLIGCNSELTYCIGLYHEYVRFLGGNGHEQLVTEFHVPEYIIHMIDQIKDKSNSAPLSREAGIVLLSDDILNTRSYVLNNTDEEVSFERIVNNTFRVRKDQNFLRLAGLSNEEVQLLKLYYSDIGGNYDAAD